MTIIKTYFLWFMIYSMVGWAYETLLCSISKKEFINRGFLNGPYCPVYGFGAVINIIILKDVSNIYILFLAGVILTCSLEYFTSWILEKIFHTRWWDYSERKLNLNGRICMIGAVIFGVFSVLLLTYLHPFIVGYTSKISTEIVSYMTTFLFAVILSDCVYTITKFTEFQSRLRKISEYTEHAKSVANEYIEKVKGRVSEHVEYEHIQDKVNELIKAINYQEKRMIRAFPKIKSMKYNDVLEKIKKHVTILKINNKQK